MWYKRQAKGLNNTFLYYYISINELMYYYATHLDYRKQLCSEVLFLNKIFNRSFFEAYIFNIMKACISVFYLKKKKWIKSLISLISAISFSFPLLTSSRNNHYESYLSFSSIATIINTTSKMALFVIKQLASSFTNRMISNA